MVWKDAVINQTTWLGGNLNVNDDEIQLAQQRIVVRAGFENSAHDPVIDAYTQDIRIYQIHNDVTHHNTLDIRTCQYTHN